MLKLLNAPQAASRRRSPSRLIVMLLLAQSGTFASASDIKLGGGWYLIGEPYEIDGQLFTPAADELYAERGTAIVAAGNMHGRMTANGENLDRTALTAAHRTLPLPSIVEITSRETGRKVLVRVNDRGPMSMSQTIALSEKAAELLGIRVRESAPIDIAYVGVAPLDGNDSLERAHLSTQAWYDTALGRVKPELSIPRAPDAASVGLLSDKTVETPTVKPVTKRPVVAAPPSASVKKTKGFCWECIGSATP